jgi:hypothetical protein
MTNQPITPPPELVQQWYRDAEHQLAPYYVFVARCAAQWGADQELGACCEWVSKYLPYLGDFPMPEDKLRAARRPKPPSLKEQALHAADLLFNHSEIGECALAQDTIRRALEALPND